MPFYDRSRELELLDNLYARLGGQLFVLYGRRRVGKTVLMTHWLDTRNHRGLFWTADRTSAESQLRSFSQAIQAFVDPGQSLPVGFSSGTWAVACSGTELLA